MQEEEKTTEQVLTKEDVKHSLAWEILVEMKKAYYKLAYITLGLTIALIIALGIIVFK